MNSVLEINRDMKVKLLNALKVGKLDLSEFNPSMEVVVIEPPFASASISRELTGNVLLSQKAYINYLESVVRGENKQPKDFVEKGLSKRQVEVNERFFKVMEVVNDDELFADFMAQDAKKV